jgi:hypothetical protein
MIPLGPIYQELRRSVLDTFPDDMPAPRADGDNFSRWIETGNYFVSRPDSKGVVLAASPQDYGQALLRDVEFLVDMCFEQMLQIQSERLDNQSPAWTVVTIYYYSFYAAQALSRILGMPTTYLDDTRVSAIKALSSTPLTLGAGPYTITKATNLSVTQAEYYFKKSRQRPHDAVWSSLLEYLGRLRQKNKPAAKSTNLVATQEFQLFEVVTSSLPSKAFPDCQFNWPSEVRYEANYRVGNAYTMLRSPWHFRSMDAMRNWEDLTIEKMVNLMKRSVGALGVEQSVQGIKLRSMFMLNFANFLFALVRTLLADLHQRRSTDWKWEDRRNRFFKKHSDILGKQESWLFP